MEKRYGNLTVFTDTFDRGDWGLALGIGKTQEYPSFQFQINFFRYLLEISWER